MRPWERISSNKMGSDHTDCLQSPAMEPDRTLGRRPTGTAAVSSAPSVRKERKKGREKLSGVREGTGCQVSNGIIHVRMPIYFGSNSFQCLKRKGNFQKLSSLHTWTFVEEIMLNLQIPCGPYSALIPGVGIRAPCAERGEERPLQCRSLSVKETQNQARKLWTTCIENHRISHSHPNKIDEHHCNSLADS